MTPSLTAALRFAARRIPANLDATAKFEKNGTSTEFGFHGSHEFSIRLPAWALREIKKAAATNVEAQT